MVRAKRAIRGLGQATATLAALGFVLPAFVSSLPGEPQIRRVHPTVTLTECEDAGGVVEARARGGAVCVGGIDDADPVVGE
jgi:hypothetical protein